MSTTYSNLTDCQIQQILDLFNQGWECRNIPSQLGVSGRAVARVLHETGINTKRRNRYTLNETYFDIIDSPVKAYLLGLLAADGCVTKTNYVAFESIDRELTELLKNELEYSGEIRIIKPQNYDPHYRVNFSSQRLANALSRYGIVPRRTFSGEYYFPKAEYLPAYVLGYFDGDGCAYLNKGRSGGSVSIVGSWEFTSELVKFLGMGSVQEHQLKKVYYWRIHSRKNIQAFSDLVYQNRDLDLGLERKRIKIDLILRSYKRG